MKKIVEIAIKAINKKNTHLLGRLVDECSHDEVMKIVKYAYNVRSYSVEYLNRWDDLLTDLANKWDGWSDDYNTEYPNSTYWRYRFGYYHFYQGVAGCTYDEVIIPGHEPMMILERKAG